jgi:large subunit ribosomal protein L28e
MASVEVLWSVIKGHSAFLLKRGQGSGGQSIFSSEKGNLRNRHSIRYNGLINKRAVDVSATEGGVAVSVKRKLLSQKPSATYVSSKQPSKNGFRKGRNAVANATSKYRPDLRRAALAR